LAFGKRKSDRPPLEYLELLDYAVKSLGSKMKSERDLRHRLKDRVSPDETGAENVEKVMAKLKDLGYLSDTRFAADYTRLRQENEKLGRRRVQQGLMQKGIPSDLASQALTKQYEDVDEVALARAYVDRKRMKAPQNDKDTARTMRRLMAAGFSTTAVWKVLRSWGAEVEEVDVVDSEDV
jgi:regulatory protein